MGTNWSFTASPWTATVRSPRTWEPITTFARSCLFCQKDTRGISRTSICRGASSTMAARGLSSPSSAMTSSRQPILSSRTLVRSGRSTSRLMIPRQPEVPVPRPPRGPSRTGSLLNSFLYAVHCAAIHMWPSLGEDGVIMGAVSAGIFSGGLTPTDLAPAPCPLKTDAESSRRSRPNQPVRCVAGVVTGQETRSARASRRPLEEARHT